MAQKLGETIKQLRKSRNMSQEDLAKVLGISFQAVSKWETHVTMPDVDLLPAIASFFGISMDTLFDFSTQENERRIEEICRRAAALRIPEPEQAEAVLREGLKQFPANESMLTILVYTLAALPGREEALIDTCKTLIECAADQGVKCDMLRILAETYHATGRKDQILPLLNQIPEFYFTKMECIAKLTEGETSLDAARFQMNLSGKSTVEMLRILESRFRGAEDPANALRCRRMADGILEVFRREGLTELQHPGYEWS